MLGDIVGASAAIEALRQDVATAARSDAKVLITGESGSGKEVVARALHCVGLRRARPLLPINCAGVPESLLESTLFGHVRGSFTGAHRDHRGLLEAAHGGTVFLDEIGEMTPRMQGLLLRFLESGEIQRVGEPLSTSRVDARIIAATNRDLRAKVVRGEFRLDLFYRLNVIHLRVPALRDRPDDVPVLLNCFLCRFARQYAVARPVLSPAAIERLVRYCWPGNVRELRNAAERLVVSSGGASGDLDRFVQRLTAPAADSTPGPAAEPAVEESLFSRISASKESFWSAVRDPFLARDLAREDVVDLVRQGLSRCSGSYRQLAVLVNLHTPGDDRRLIAFLKKYRCFVSEPQLRATA